jgi:hypothetical protein
MEENLDENLKGNKEQSYYDDNKGKKIRDIVFGFFGGLFVCIIIGGIFAQSGAAGAVAIWLSVIAYITAIIIFLSKGRKYIAIGLILLAIVPLIVLGGCLLVMR